VLPSALATPSGATGLRLIEQGRDESCLGQFDQSVETVRACRRPRSTLRLRWRPCSSAEQGDHGNHCADATACRGSGRKMPDSTLPTSSRGRSGANRRRRKVSPTRVRRGNLRRGTVPKRATAALIRRVPLSRPVNRASPFAARVFRRVVTAMRSRWRNTTAVGRRRFLQRATRHKPPTFCPDHTGPDD